jgi:hypothetical protein
MGCCSTRAQVRHAAPLVFPVDFDGGEHVYRVHPINVQLVTDPVIMPAKEEHGWPQAFIQRLIGYMRRRCEAVVTARGGQTSY